MFFFRTEDVGFRVVGFKCVGFKGVGSKVRVQGVGGGRDGGVDGGKDWGEVRGPAHIITSSKCIRLSWRSANKHYWSDCKKKMYIFCYELNRYSKWQQV